LQSQSGGAGAGVGESLQSDPYPRASSQEAGRQVPVHISNTSVAAAVA